MTGMRTGATLFLVLLLAGCSRTGFREFANGVQNRARAFAAAQELKTQPSQTQYDGPSSGQPAAEKAAEVTAEAAPAVEKKAEPQSFIYYYEAPPPPAPVGP